MRISSKEQRERFVLVFAVLFILAGGYLGNHSALSLNTLLGAILAAVIIMGWIVSSTIAGCLQSIQRTLLDLGDRGGKAQ
jgi:uncharacterized membrane protein AbrB (regulator of aidB expression)